MSIESAKAFIERMKTDEEFARQVSNQKDNEERMKFFLAEGFNFTIDEINSCQRELSDTELSEVSAAGDENFPDVCVSKLLGICSRVGEWCPYGDFECR